MTEHNLYVSPKGDDRWSGTLADSDGGGSDGPLATLERARDAARVLRRDGAQVTITLRGGTYVRSESLVLTAEDSGTSSGPTCWQAYPGEEAAISGGTALTGFGPVTDPAVRERLDPSVRDSVMEASLGDMDPGSLDPRSGNRLEVYVGERVTEPASYPRKDWIAITEVPQEGEVLYEGETLHQRNGRAVGRHCGRISFDDTRPRSWAPSTDLWVHGYWVWEWADQYLPVEHLDSEAGELTPAAPHHNYGYQPLGRFRFLNVLEELREPGQWFLDSARRALYLYPPAGSDATNVVVSSLTVPLLRIEGAEHLAIRGLHFTCSRGSAITTADASHLDVAECEFTSLGQTAVVIKEGAHNVVSGCHIHDVSAGGVILTGGDRRTLAPGHGSATSNHIHHYAHRIRTYQTAVSIEGVGIRVANNLIHDAPHMAIGFSGNDHVIELNEIHDVVTETNDAGAVYNGRDPSQQGTVIRHNFFHRIGREQGHGSNAVYFDDALCGNTVFGNVFLRAGLPGAAQMGAVFIHGGRYNTIENNVFVDCERAYGESPWNDETWIRFSSIHGWQERLYETVDITKPPFTDRYPWLAGIMEDRRPNRLVRNLVVRCTDFLGRGEQELQGNLITDDDPGIVDPSTGTLVRSAGTWVCKEIPGFQAIPLDRIGLMEDK